MSDRPEAGYLPSGVWRIKGVQNTVYLAGTSHVVTDDQIPFPSPFYAAYQDAAEVYVEFDTDLSCWAKFRLLRKMWPWIKTHGGDFTCPKGRTLADYLSPETLGQLRTASGKDYSKKRITPIFVLLQSEMGALDPREGGAVGVEDIFTLRARKEGKPIRELDDKNIVDNALKAMDEMTLGWKADIARRGADAVIQESLRGEGTAEEGDAGWRRGSLEAVEQLQARMKQESPFLYEKGVVARNHQWLDKLEAALRGKKNVLVLVGVAHLGGADGLLHLLGERGFPAVRLYGVDRPLPAPVRAIGTPEGSANTRGYPRSSAPAEAANSELKGSSRR